MTPSGGVEFVVGLIELLENMSICKSKEVGARGGRDTDRSQTQALNHQRPCMMTDHSSTV